MPGTCRFPAVGPFILRLCPGAGLSWRDHVPAGLETCQKSKHHPMPPTWDLPTSYWMKHFKLNQPAFSKKKKKKSTWPMMSTGSLRRNMESKINFPFLLVLNFRKDWSFPREWKAWTLTYYKTYKNMLMIFKDRTSTVTTMSGKKPWRF